MDTAYGALVARILPEGPAADSPLRVGDIITHFNDQKVITSSSLPPLVGRVRANNNAQIRVIREGSAESFEVKIGELPPNAGRRSAQPQSSGEPAAGKNSFKITVAEMDEETRTRLGVDRGGVLITEVVTAGPAGQAGIKPGVALLRVDNAAVDSIEDFNSVISQLDVSKPIAVLIHSESGPQFLAITVDE